MWIDVERCRDKWRDVEISGEMWRDIDILTYEILNLKILLGGHCSTVFLLYCKHTYILIVHLGRERTNVFCLHIYIIECLIGYNNDFLGI